MEELKKEVISGIRACLISTKGRVSLRQLTGDYQTIIGTRIPYAKLGFNRLEDLIQAEPTLVLSKNAAGEVFVDAKSSDKSAHITEMVTRQKTSKRAASKSVRFHMTSSKHRPAAATSKWRPKDMNNRWKNYQNSSRPAAVSHNQFVNRYAPPSVPSKVVVPKSSTLNNKPQTTTNNFSSKPGIQNRLQLLTNNKTVTMHRGSGERVVSNSSAEANTKPLKNISNLPNGLNPASDSCNPLVNTRKRITRKMSELSLDSDSGNSSPTGDGTVPQSPCDFTRSVPVFENVIPPPVFENVAPSYSRQSPKFVRTDNPVADLKSFAEMKKLGDIDVSFKEVRTKQNRLFTCKIKVGKHIYQSYPKEFVNRLAAEIYCAEEALKELVPKYQRRKSLLLSSEIDILERIPPMLEKHHHGIWVWQLKLDYADKYNEQLPVDFLKIIDTSPCIQVEKCSEDYVLRHCKPGDALQKGQKRTQLTIPNVSVPSNTVQFGEDGKLFAQVTCVMSANEIWCRQCETEESEIYSDMNINLEIYYSANEASLKTDSIVVAGYYIAKFDNSYYRVRAVSVNENEINCFFIDFGDETIIPKEDLFRMTREFAKAQAQAFVCRLVGLEELYEASCSNSESLQNLLYKQVVLELCSETDENPGEVSIPVYMYDFETGNSVNEALIPVLTLESASPILQKEAITEVYVTNIESNGDVYVQLHSHGYDVLQDLIARMEAQIVENPPTNLLSPITKTNSVDRLYFAKYKADCHWYRIKIIDWSPAENLAQIYFVDYGNTDVINVKNEVMYPTEALSDVLSQYPHQAVKVKMALDVVPQDFVKLAKTAMPEDQPALLKIVEIDNDEVPWVEFFRRNADGGLFCINKSISMEMELKKGDGNNNVNNVKRKLVQFDGAKNVPSAGLLSRPAIPQKGEYFEVHIPFSVNPYNFFVQPLESKAKLNQMMQNLQDRYKDVQYSPLQVDEIIPGNIYVSKHDDGFWYRTSVIKVIYSGSISVFYCDFGYYANLTLGQLIPLDPEFMELPYQALKAKLSGIKPKQSKWTMEDCEDFKTLAEKKSFYSILMDIEKDELYESDLVLNLLLIDTSSAEDIYVGKELIKKGIAVEA